MPFAFNDAVRPVCDWRQTIGPQLGPFAERCPDWYPSGRGFCGGTSTRIGISFGVNLVMHVLTGNLNSDRGPMCLRCWTGGPMTSSIISRVR